MARRAVAQLRGVTHGTSELNCTIRTGSYSAFFLSYGPAKVPPARQRQAPTTRGVTNARDTDWRRDMHLEVLRILTLTLTLTLT